MLSNLLENALEASLNTDSSRQQIKIQAYLHSGCMILLTVENAFDRCVKEKNGVFQSSKRKGEGTGIQSIRRIAEKMAVTAGFSMKTACSAPMSC
ncbi:MAG: GHKL domain-containing protein [Clostridia bacterium]